MLRESLIVCELARQLAMDPGNLIQALDSLEADGLLTRQRDEKNRRQRLVTLSPKGRRLLAKAHRATARAEANVFGSLTQADRSAYYAANLAVYQWLHRDRAPQPSSG